MCCLAEMHGDVFSRHVCPLKGAVSFVTVDNSTVDIANDPKRRASPVVAFEPRRRVFVTLCQPRDCRGSKL